MYDKPFRLHISSIIEQSFKVFGIIIVVMIANFFNLVSDLASGKIGFNEMMISVLVLFVFILLLVLFFYIRWRKTYIILLKDTLIIERNLLFKYKMTVGLKNIATVELEQNIFERFLDTAKVKIDTNSLSTANQTDLKIILKKNLADQLRK
ncbi:MAG: PH domain-containing protein, partial [Clostridia bacterium]|nr:PH domain-containing protein [Clostridia bacterium]